MRKQSFYLALGLAAALAVGQARAGSVTLDTGVNTFAASGLFTGTTGTVTPPGFPFPPGGPWYVPPGPAEWIAPTSTLPITTATSLPNGPVDYTTTITLASAPAYLWTGVTMADDSVTGVNINGHQINFSPPIVDSNLLHGLGGPPVSLPSGLGAYLVAGVNTITIDTMNLFHGPTGLYLSSSIVSVPEPASMALLGIGLTALLTLRRFRTRHANA